MTVDLSQPAVTERLRRASDLAGSLRPEHRLEHKIALDERAVAARIKQASDLLDVCRALAGRRT